MLFINKKTLVEPTKKNQKNNPKSPTTLDLWDFLDVK
jgi:hypothetical protein